VATYVILSRVSPEAFADPAGFRQLAKAVSETIRSECPGVTWKASYATLGRFDVVDIVEADDPKQVEKATASLKLAAKEDIERLEKKLDKVLGRKR